MSLCKNSFSSSSNARLPSSILKENRHNIQKQNWEMFCKKGVLLCHVSMTWTLVDLFCTKRLFSQEAVFCPYYFTRDNNVFVLQGISYSCAINKIKTGTLCRILNYSTENLKYRITIDSYLLRIEKKSVIFSGSKQIPQRNNIVLSQENM